MGSDNQHYRRHGMKEGDPGDIHPDDAVYPAPSVAHDYNEKPDIKESGLGRDQGEMPKVEHEKDFSQIDPESARHAPAGSETRSTGTGGGPDAGQDANPDDGSKKHHP